MTLDEMLRQQREAEEAAIARAEQAALISGKERFDLARLEEHLGAEPGSRAAVARSLRRQYYLVHTGVRTLAEYATLLRELAQWE